MKKYHVSMEFDWDAVTNLLCAFAVGMFVGLLVTLGVHDTAVAREQHRQYKIKHPESTITYEEYKRLRD
jgi:hypothetical protein